MDVKEIAEILQEIAVLLELKGENTFKIRAYQSGARTLEGLDDDIDELIAEDRLGEVPGIGKALTEKISTLRMKGSLPFYDDLKASIAPGLIEMLDIPGFGPKKIKKVHEELGIDTIDALAKACEEGKVAALAGFGKKSEEKILLGIKNREAYGMRHLWWKANEVAQPILKGLRELKDVIRAEAAGSLRRGKETVGDLDFIVSSSNPQPVMEWFTQLDDIQEVTAKGETKSSIRLKDGLQADLRVVPDDRFVFALHHFTGSKDHNVKMRQRALARDLSLSEWGIFNKGDEAGADGAKAYDRALAVDSVKEEKDLFEALGLNWIPPEMREGRDELTLAESNDLPVLVEEKDLKGVFHNHTKASDGRNTLEELAAAAEERGWEYFGIADHSKASFQAKGINEDQLLDQVKAIRALNESKRFKTYLFAGNEVDILKDGSLDFSGEVLAELDYCVISVHSSMSGLSEEEMTQRIIRAIETDTGCLKMLGHLTGRLLLRREPYAVNIRKVIDAAAANNCLIELNANPSRLDMDWRHWGYAAEKGIPCVINPDAHAIEHIDFTKAGVLTARKAGLTKAQVFNTLTLKEILRRIDL